MKLVPLLSALIVTLFLPVIFVFLLPVLVYRWILSIIYPVFASRVLKILPPSSSIYATQNKETHVLSNILIELEFDQKVSYEEVLTAVSERMILAKGRKGRLLYPEFTHYVHPCLGYYFWREEPKFQIQDHVNVVAQMNPETRTAFLEEYFDPEQSPWKVLLVDGVEGQRILFKYHHTLGDGYSILNALVNCADDAPTTNRKSTKLAWWKIPIFPVLALYDLFTVGGQNVQSPWDRKVEGRSKTRVYSKPRSVNKEMVGECSKALQVSFTSALFGGIGVGIDEFLKAENVKVPQLMNAIVPFPGTSRSRKLDNSYGVGTVPIPILPSVEEVVNGIENSINEMKDSTSPTTILLIFKLIGLLPVEGYQQKRQVPPLFISTFPGPRKRVYLNGNPITGINFQMHLGGDFPLIVSTISYDGRLSYVLGGDRNVFTAQSIEDLSTVIRQKWMNLVNESKSPV